MEKINNDEGFRLYFSNKMMSIIGWEFSLLKLTSKSNSFTLSQILKIITIITTRIIFHISLTNLVFIILITSFFRYWVMDFGIGFVMISFFIFFFGSNNDHFLLNFFSHIKNKRIFEREIFRRCERLYKGPVSKNQRLFQFLFRLGNRR